jgi:hypothetical protein
MTRVKLCRSGRIAGVALFGPSRFLDRDTEDWHFEAWAWLLRNLGGVERMRRSPLVTPSKEFFPPTEAQGHERVQHALDCVKEAMGMRAWECRLVADPRPPASIEVGEFWNIRNPGAAGGTFSVKDGIVMITYAPDLVREPVRLVATLAHEMAHYLLATVREEPPGGHELHELVTDLTVAYAGFGVFGANAAFDFSQFTETGRQGWNSRRLGYLSERTWALALATYLHLTGRRGEADRWLKPGLQKMVAAADRHLAKQPRLLEPLMALA